MRNMQPCKSKRCFMAPGLALLLFLLAACGTNTTITGSNGPAATATTLPTQLCGTVHTLRQQVVPGDQKSAKGVEECFWQAYQQCHPAKLVYSQGSVDTVMIHTFSLKSQSGKCVITDALQHVVIPHPPQSEGNHTCTGLEQQAAGLRFLACTDEGNVLVPQGNGGAQ